jgi:hypothetical protein
MVLENILPSVQPQSFLEWTRTSFEESAAEFYTILLGGGNLFLTLVSKTDKSRQ